jgi:hypothetical protein
MSNPSTRYTCRLGDFELTFIQRTWSKGTTWREYEAAPRMYMSIDDETIIDNLMNRRSRPYNFYKTLIHGSTLNQVLNLGKLQWSQHAGCTCNCSPGFILPRQTISIGEHKFTNFDVWLKVCSVAPAELAVR